MRVSIGPYTSDIIPVRSWENNYEFWRKPDTCYLPEAEYTKFDKFVFGFFDKLYNFVLPLNRWSNNRKRKIDIQIDSFDVWGVNHTLALIIHPVLSKLKEQKRGSPYVDVADVPENLRPSEEPNDENGHIDDTHCHRWNWILDEMIWAFEQHTLDGDDENQFHHNSDQLDLDFTSCPDDSNYSTLNINYQKDPSKPAYWVDEAGKKKHHERKQNGLRLFAKYYEDLWD